MPVKRVKYFSIDAEDKPGVLANFCGHLRDQEVNLNALWAFGVGMGRAKIFLIPQNPEKFLKAVKVAGHQPKEGAAFYLTGKDRVGALCKTLDMAKAANTNVHALNALALSGTFGAYIWPDENNTEELARALGAQ